MKSLPQKILLLISLFFFTATAWAYSFDANLDFTVNGEKYTGRIYYAGNKLRQDMKNSQGKEETLIFREDLQKIWIVDPVKHTYIEKPMTLNIAASTGIFDAIRTRSKSRLVENGKNGDKYLVEIVSDTQDIRFYVWKEPGRDVPLKVENLEGTVKYDYSEVNNRPQDSSLFELPAGSTRSPI